MKANGAATGIVRGVLRLAVIVACVVGASSAEAAQSPARRAGLRILDLVVDQVLLEKLQATLVISDEQRAAMSRSHDLYWQTIIEIDARGWERGLDAGWREIEQIGEEVRAAMSLPHNPDGSLPITAIQQRQDQRMAELRSGYKRAWLAARLESDKAMSDWFSGLRDIGVLDKDRDLSVRRFVLRANLDNRGSSIGDDCHRVPEILRLIEGASAAGNELHDLRQQQQFERDLQAVILEYELSLDGWLTQRLAEERRMPLDREPQSISSLDAQWDEFQRRQGAIWGRRYDISRLAASAIGELASEYGGEVVASKWENRFLTAFCGELMKARLPETLPQWLATRSDATPEQMAAVAAWDKVWTAERDRLRQRAIAAGVRGKRQVEWLVSRQPPALDYAHCLLDVHVGARKAVASFVALLTADQRRDLQPEIDGLDARPTDERLGPPIEPDALQGILLQRPTALNRKAIPS